MKTFSKIVIGTVAGVGIVLAAAAYAHNPGYGYGYGHGMGMYGQGGYGPGMGMHGPQGYGGPGMGGYGGPGSVDGRLDAIKSALKLTGNQTKAWDTFEKSVRSQAESMNDKWVAMREGGLSPEAHIAFMEQRLAGMKAVQKARTDLYEVLTPEQKTIIDRAGFCGQRY